MQNLLVRSQSRRPQIRTPAERADYEHVGVVPFAGPRPTLAPRLPKADALEIGPLIEQVAAAAPQMSTDFGTPLPYVAVAVLAQRIHDVPIGARQRVAH